MLVLVMRFDEEKRHHGMAVVVAQQLRMDQSVGVGGVDVQPWFVRVDIEGREFRRGVSRVEIERAANKLKIDIHTSRPGIIIGRKGAEVDKLKEEVKRRTSREVFINIQEIQKPELDAQLIAESVAMQLEKRVAFRRAMRKAVASATKGGALGIRIQCSGRLGGSEMGRRAPAALSGSAVAWRWPIQSSSTTPGTRSRPARRPTSSTEQSARRVCAGEAVRLRGSLPRGLLVRSTAEQEIEQTLSRNAAGHEHGTRPPAGVADDDDDQERRADDREQYRAGSGEGVVRIDSWRDQEEEIGRICRPKKVVVIDRAERFIMK